MVEDLSHGNINIFILFLVIGCIYAWHRRRDDWLACCCAGRLLQGHAAVAGAVFRVQTAMAARRSAGPREWACSCSCSPVRFWAGRRIKRCCAAGPIRWWCRIWVRGEVSSEHPNQSLPGVATRLLTHIASFSAFPDDVYTPTAYHNVAIGRDGVRWLVRICQLLFAGLVVLVCRNVRARWLATGRGVRHHSCRHADIQRTGDGSTIV